MCEQVCPHGVFSQENGQMELVAEPACIECGACKTNCPVGAIEVNTGVG